MMQLTAEFNVKRIDVRKRSTFESLGFEGFVALGDAVVGGPMEARGLDSPGVYAIFAPPKYIPSFLTEDLKNVITPWTQEQLWSRWVEEAELAYIGCAGRTPTNRILRKRIGDFRKHGAGRISTSGPHKGGERIWQCKGWAQFTLAWLPTDPFPHPHNTEVAIGTAFLALTGVLPFANVRL
jgi:hypothetical protein